MDHNIRLKVSEHRLPRTSVGHITDNKLRCGMQVCRSSAGWMDLRVQVIEHDPTLGALCQFMREGASDKTSTSGD
jgi:hypothetical protein